jgi:prepilin-type N-terminal cleavage/methylation domain-containing protein
MDEKKKSRGFSLLEVMISLLVLLVVSGAAFRALAYYQRSYGSSRMKAVMHEGVRGAVELISQEVGQAGLLDFTTQTTSTAINASLVAQPVGVTSVNSIFKYEILIIDTSTGEERVTVTDLDPVAGTITAVFTKNHPANTVVRGYGIFYQGIMPPGLTGGSDGNNLKIFGDIKGDQSITYVKYTCDTTAGTLRRSMTVVTPTTTTLNASDVLVDNLMANPGNVACFQYPPNTVAGPYTFVTSVAITLSVRTSKVDPQTRQYVTMTKSFLNLAPRNVLAGKELALSGSQTRLQPTPSNIPLFY